jgi:hypothetical protein
MGNLNLSVCLIHNIQNQNQLSKICFCFFGKFLFLFLQYQISKRLNFIEDVHLDKLNCGLTLISSKFQVMTKPPHKMLVTLNLIENESANHLIAETMIVVEICMISAGAS